MNGFWKAALKYHAPATISGFIFFYLTSRILSENDLLNGHPKIALFVLIVVMNFCAFLLYRTTQVVPKASARDVVISGNKIKGNKIAGSVSLSAGKNGYQGTHKIKNNKVLDNEVEGDVVIGSKNANE